MLNQKSIIKMGRRFIGFLLLSATSLLLCSCMGEDMADESLKFQANSREFSLRFKAVSDSQDVECGKILEGYGANNTESISIRDIRFYISKLKFYDKTGGELPVELMDNDFQYQGVPKGHATALIDLTNNTEGDCVKSTGTDRINDLVIGIVGEGDIHAVSFDVGMGLSLMNELRTPEIPNRKESPFSEMQWTWVFGMIDMLVGYSAINEAGMEDRGLLNLGPLWKENFYPSVYLDGFSPEKNTVTLNLKALLAGAEALATECHGGVSGICATVYTNLGVDYSDSSAITHSPEKNTVFAFD